MATSIKLNDLEFGREQLGSGVSATVYKGIWKSMKMTVAIKTMTQEVPAKELEIMSLVDHPNLVHFYGAVLQPPTYCIVTEYAEQGSLFEFLHQHEFDSDRNLKWTRQIAAGMKYLHFDVPNQVVIHGDLKSKNVLVTADNTAKICDFGSSKLRDQLPGMSILTITKIHGTPRWMAPETQENKPISKQCDVYSYGIVVWELLTHKIPFEDISDLYQLYRSVVLDKKRPPLPATCAPVLANLLKKCWDPDPQLRPEFTDIVSNLEHLPQMLVDKGSQLQPATEQPQTAHQKTSTLHLHLEKPRPVPRPRSPRPVPKPRNLQGRKIPKSPESAQASLLGLPPVPRPRSRSMSEQTEDVTKPESTARPRSASAKDQATPIEVRIPEIELTVEGEKHSMVEAEVSEWEKYEDISEDEYDVPQSIIQLPPKSPTQSDSPQLHPEARPGWAISRDEVELLDDELGKGAWGVVRKARFRGDIVAAKCLHEALMQERSEFLYKAIRREMNIAANLRHPNLVLFLGAVIDGDLAELIILSELMDSSLRDVLAEERLARSQIKSLSSDVARALNYLHSFKPDPLIHRDVSSANVLLERLGPDNWKAKVSDYGSLRAINLACTMAPGNPVYAAPEAMQPGLQSCKMDTYSFGVLLIEMCSCKLPTPDQRVRLLLEMKWPKMQTLIERCIQGNPSDRPKMQDIISALEQLPVQKLHVRQLSTNYVEMRWFVPSISRIEAENKLISEGKEGNFLVRFSTSTDPNSKYSLSLFNLGKVYHYRIWQNHQNNEFYIHDNLQFQTLEEMIEYYKKTPVAFFTTLREYLPSRPRRLSHQSSHSDEAWEIPKSELRFGSETARGQCGYVVAGAWKGLDVTIRVTKQEAMDEEVGLQFIGDAVKILKEFHHENLVKLYGICTHEGSLLIVTELIPRGPLDKYIQQHQELLERHEVLLDMAIQICSALKFLEKKGIAHGDLAARNCLVGERNVVKVADYSLALYTSPRKPSRTVVSIRWAAPELIVQLPIFTTKSDVWSFGIILWELWSGGLVPYQNLRNLEVKDKLLAGHRLEKPENCPDEVYGLMHNCWKVVSQQRPSFASLYDEFSALATCEDFGVVTELQKAKARKLSTMKLPSCRLFCEELETPKSELTLGNQLGNGACGYIVAGTWKGVDVAVRVTREKAMNEDGLRFIEEAINILKEFQHDKLLKLYGVCTQEGPVFIVTELLAKGSLHEYLQQHRVLVEKTELLLDMATQICSAMKFLEIRGIVHKDVATRNCLVGDRNVVKLADYSLPLFTSERTTASNCVPIRWAAPEVLKAGQFSTKSDVWSFGILLWELWTAAKKPYSSLRQNQQVIDEVAAGYRLEKPNHCPQHVYELMRNCWTDDTEPRPSFAVLYDNLRVLGTPDDTFGMITGLQRPPPKPVPRHSSVAVLYDITLEIPKSQLTFGRELASGKYGYVMSGRWGIRDVAIRVANDNALTEEGLQFIEEAVAAMRKFQHPNLLRMHGLCTREGALFIVTELTQQGTLVNYLRQQPQLVENQEVLLSMATQICSAMRFLEVNGIIHKDLAARNCLVGENNVVKVTDFSLPIFTSDRKPSKTCFPIKWSAPEVLKDDEFSSKSDVWSYGILLWEIWSGGQVPYPNVKLQQTVEQVLAGYRLYKPQHCPEEVYKLMQQCWEMRPANRPSFAVLTSYLQRRKYYKPLYNIVAV